jgi:hypothetical protein
MDSSRSGPLSSFIMMLPLIVVPAIALLRPAENGSSIVSDDLSAATEQDPLSDFDELDFDSLVGDPNGGRIPENRTASDNLAETNAPPFSEGMTDPSSGGSPHSMDHLFPDAMPNAMGPSQSMQARLQELQNMGATRTLWFNPGTAGQTGFVAFFPSAQGNVTYRFSAIAESDMNALDDVLRQVKEWQGITQPAAPAFPDADSGMQSGF